jgi:ankyrin repeat protein
MDQSVRRFKSLAWICKAITEGDIAKATKLVELEGPSGFDGVASDRIGESPIMLALSTGHPRLAARLVAAGYQPDLWEAAALDLPGELHSIACSTPERLEICNVDGWAPMHLACYAHAHNALAVLCEFAADPNILSCNSALETPLHAAVRVDDARLVETLIAAGADTRFTDAAGRTPMQLAIELTSVSACNVLASIED